MNIRLAIDIGASSGRFILGYIREGNLELKEIYRFSNSVIEQDKHLIWDIENLWKEIKKGIHLALTIESKIDSISIDTWGVDYVLLNHNKPILPVYAYRDARTKCVIQEVHNKIPFQRLYEITGTQFQEFNTIYQLYWDKLNQRLSQATDFLMMPEYFIYKLTGIKIKEFTNASTTGFFDIKASTYSKEVITKLGFDERLFSKPSLPGVYVGDFTKELQEELGGNIPVVLTATHDTASAVEGIPMDGAAPYISSGTWSLLGMKINNPILSQKARLANYSNELGPDYVRFQKNIMGLWIIQRLSLEMSLDFPTMVKMAGGSTYSEIFDVNDPLFLSSLHMKESILEWFKSHNKSLPNTDADYINSTYMS
ncbi:MAG: hypothetical protein K2K15_04830, partial [Anaeroplasmataceae bacterium]|nr:hypothetical protein [Anaeroplasmataceae bacterium]